MTVSNPINHPSAKLLALSILLLPSAAWSQAGTGLKGDYFNNKTLTAPATLSRVDPAVNFQWAAGAPAPGVNADSYSVRWSGKMEAPVAGAYTFFTRSDDGVRLWIDGKLLINHWNDHSPYTDQSVPVTLAAGQRYDIQLEFYENSGVATMQLYWSYPGQGEQIIPTARLFPTPITLQPAPAAVSRIWLSDLPWLSANNGYGPFELDKSNGELGARDGKTLTIAGRRYSYGIGAHSPSEIRYALDDRFDMFRAVVGVDDEVGNNGSVRFEVWLDDRRVFQSPIMRGNMPGLAIAIPVEDAKQMRLVVTDAGDGISYDHADWAEARLEGVERVKYLSDMGWVSATNGSGPVERDRANGGSTSSDGERIRLRGQTYRKGLGTHAVSEIKYKLEKRYELFSTVIGVDDTAPAQGSAVFEVWTGNSRLFRSNTLRKTDPVQHVTINVRQFDDLILKVLDASDGNTGDFGDWADAKLLPIGSDDVTPPTVPSTLTATPGDRQITLSWGASTGALSYNVYRGTTADGESTSPIATNITARTFTNTGLSNGTKYFFKVRAVNGAGMSPLSNEASAMPLPQLPAEPTSLSADAGDAKVTLKWQGAARASSYNIYRGTTAGGQASTPIATNVTSTTWVNTGLTNGTKYFYKVKGVNTAGTGGFSNEASATPVPPLPNPPAAPTNLTGAAGNSQVTLNWQASATATSYNVYRGTSSGGESTTPVATNVTGTTFVNTGLTNGTKYYFKVRGVNAGGMSGYSNEASATPVPAAPGVPTQLTAAPGNARVVLTWAAVTGATSYKVFRGTASNGQSTTPIATNVTASTYTNTGLTNGTAYFYKVSAVNAGGDSALSNEASATPIAPPVAPTGLTATPGNTQITLAWQPVTGATSYNLYRGTTAGGQGTTPLVTGLTAPNYVNTGLTNGTAYYYRVAALNASGEGSRSSEASATPFAPPTPADPATVSAFRLLRQATWGPRPGDLDRVKQMGANAFLNEQFAQPPSVYPDTLYDVSVELTQEHLMRLALTGPDQLRQRAAWALHQIWVVSGVEITNARAIVNYQRVLMNGAFGNYRDLMLNMTLNPAMGRYLNMLNNKSEQSSGVPPNENYARELLQLFTVGLNRLNADGSVIPGSPTYTEEDVKELARILTGWTYGDGNQATVPNNLASTNWTVPMEAVERFHDTGAKTFLGEFFAPGATARQDLDHALNVIFNHPNVGPFIGRILIQRLVTSNPSPGYIAAVAAAFANNGSGVRGDLTAVFRAILTHPEAGLGTSSAGKLMEPALFVISQARSLNAQVADHPFMTDLSEEMGQKVLYPGSVFSYFSPNARIRGTTLFGPEYQILTAVTTLSRTNFVGRLISNGFGADVVIDFTPFTSRAADAAALVDYCNLLFMGGLMSPEQRNEIVTAVQVTAATNTTERVRTALYLTLASAQYQVDR